MRGELAAQEGQHGLRCSVGLSHRRQRGLLQHLGFGSHEEWLRRFAERIIGVHLHDVVGLSDHMAAGLGQIDWNMVASYLPAGSLRTCEFQSFNSPEQVAAGLKWLIAKGCG